MVQHWMFDTFILVMIGLNSILLAFNNPLDTDETKQAVLESLELVFLAVFTLEMLVKIVALGFVQHEDSYLRSSWNQLDAAVVILGYLVFLPGASSNLSSVRCVRLMRPLRTVSAFPSLRVLVNSIFYSLPMMKDVLLLTVFAFFLFGILGVQLFAGKLRQRCFVDATGLLDETVDSLCRRSSVPGSQDWYACPLGSSCLMEASNPNKGVTGFDNILQSWVTIVQCTSLEGWVDVMYMAFEAVSYWSCIYFIMMIMLIAFFILELSTGVVVNAYESVREAEDTRDKAKAAEAAAALAEAKRQAAKEEAIEEEKQVDIALNASAGAGADGQEEAEENAMVALTVKQSKKERDRQRQLDIERQRKLAKGKLSLDDPAYPMDNINAIGVKGVCFRLARSSTLRLFALVLIIGNTIVLAMEHHGMSDSFATSLEISNLVFTALFALELVVKLYGLGWEDFQRDGFNLFDFVIVVFSLLELIVQEAVDSDSAGGGLSGLRALRVLRVFRLAKSWTNLQRLILNITRSFSKMGAFSVLLLLFIFIMGLVGIQFFAGKMLCEEDYGPGQSCRSNFDSFGWALVFVFQIMGGENWNDGLYDGVDNNGWGASIYFISVYLLGNFLVLNLFLAILLSGEVEDEYEDEDENEDEEVAEGVDFDSPNAVGNAADSLAGGNVGHSMGAAGEPVKRQNTDSKSRNNKVHAEPIADDTSRDMEAAVDESKDKTEGNGRDVRLIDVGVTAAEGAGEQQESKSMKGAVSFVIDGEGDQALASTLAAEETSSSSMKKSKTLVITNGSMLSVTGTEGSMNKIALTSVFEKASKYAKVNEKKGSYIRTKRSVSTRNLARTLQMQEEEEDEETDGEEEERVWMASKRHAALWFLEGDNPFRVFCHELSSNRFFEGFILLTIVFSTIVLTFEDVNLQEGSTTDDFLVIANYITTFIFLIEMGVRICALGFCLHKGSYLRDPWNVLDFLIVVVSVLDITLSDIAFLKAFRVLRALRPLRSVRRFESMLVVVETLFRTIPAIFNVLMVSVLFHLVFGILGVNFFSGKFYWCETEPDAVDDTLDKVACLAGGYVWKNPDVANFDNIFNSMLALFEIASMEMWPDVMYRAVDISVEGGAPKRDNHQEYSIYFAVYIIIGCFFINNLFVDAVVDSFRQIHEEIQGNALLTLNQRRWIDVQRLMLNAEPKIRLPAPTSDLQRKLQDLTQHNLFEQVITGCILANIFVMSLWYWDSSDGYETTLLIFNYFFGVIFLLEALIKICANRSAYFADPWNMFDFVIVLASLIGVFVLLTGGSQGGFNPSILRVFRGLRIIRLIKRAKNLRLLIRTLQLSLPAFFNVGGLMLLLFIVYAVAGMSMFKGMPHGENLNIHTNFDNFGMAMLTLFRCVTGESYNGVMHDLMPKPARECEVLQQADPSYDCGSKAAVPYFLSFVVLGQFMMLSLFVAVVLQEFDSVGRKEKEVKPLQQEDLNDYAEAWQSAMPTPPWWNVYTSGGGLSEEMMEWDRFIRILPLIKGKLRPSSRAVMHLNLPLHLKKVSVTKTNQAGIRTETTEERLCVHYADGLMTLARISFQNETVRFARERAERKGLMRGNAKQLVKDKATFEQLISELNCMPATVTQGILLNKFDKSFNISSSMNPTTNCLSTEVSAAKIQALWKGRKTRKSMVGILSKKKDKNDGKGGADGSQSKHSHSMAIDQQEQADVSGTNHNAGAAPAVEYAL